MSTSTDSEVVSKAWPADGLESVRACPCCSSARRILELGGLEDRIFGCAPGRWTLFRCLDCRCVYLDPRPDRHTIGLAYRNYYTHGLTKRRPRSKLATWIRDGIANCYRNRLFGTTLRPSFAGGWILASMAGSQAHALRLDGRGLDRVVGFKGKLLDIGCGNGGFLELARQAGWECFGVEPDREAAAIAMTQGIKIVGSQVDGLCGRFDGYFDVITLNHVIEHVHDPAKVFRDCWSMLKSGSFVWLETPNIDSAGYEIYSRAWRGLEPPRHLVIFNPQALVSCIAAVGFKDIAVLKPRDAVEYTFLRSAYTSAGSLAEVDPSPLSRTDHLSLRENIRKARSLTRRDPGRSEFINVVAYKP